MKRGNIVFGAGVLAILGLVVGAYLYILGPSGPALEGPEEEATSDEALLTSSSGVVEIRSLDGSWRPAAVGARVRPGAGVRTRDQGKAVLQYGEDFRVEVAEDSSVEVDSVGPDVTRLVVGEGLTVVDVGPKSKRRVQVAAAGSDAIAETQDGRLHVLNDGKGGVRAAVSRGRAKVRARGKTVRLKKGFATQVRPGKAPSNPRALPKSLLLKVKWPKAGPTKKKRHLVAGKANPGSRVRVGSQVVTANDDGDFEAVVELKEGANTINIFALDVMGRTAKESSETIDVDTRGPSHAVETDPNMWNR